jgi:cytochrome c oxidase cbb3-type subunit 1
MRGFEWLARLKSVTGVGRPDILWARGHAAASSPKERDESDSLHWLDMAAGIVEPARAFLMRLGSLAARLGRLALMRSFDPGPTQSPAEVSGLPNCNFAPVKAATLLALFWGLAAMAGGVYIAFELAFSDLNIAPWLNFGRLAPLHASAAIYAFGGNVLLATSFYVVQRTCRMRLAGDLAPWFVVLGFNFFILIAGAGYLLGIPGSKEYAAPEWYADLWLTIVWVVYLLVFLGTIFRREEPRIFVANWFYLAFILTIAMLHIGDNVAALVSVFSSKSYVVWSGVRDAMFQWWHGHNAVGSSLTAGFLAIMYYFVPERAERPIYSYRLATIHFWSLVILFFWAGPRNLRDAALPDWAQTLGLTLSILLWAASWGGMINGLLTLSGAWDKLRTDPVLRMLVVSVAFYGASTFEEAAMSIKSVDSLSRYNNWTDGNLHSDAFGWVAFVSFGAIYCLVPWLWNKRDLYSLRLVNWHFWIASLGIVLYITSMWVSGILQGLMWRSYTPQGYLEYSFIETVAAMHPFYIIRAIGGSLFLIAYCLMLYNVYMTITASEAAAPAGQPSLQPAE